MTPPVRPASFPRQFLVFDRRRSEPPTRPDGFVAHDAGQLTVFACPRLPVLPLVDRGGNKIGFLVGEPIDLEAARRLTGTVTLDAHDADGVDRAIEALYQRLAGTFVIVLDGIGVQRTYLDACGSMSLVFDPATKVAAATTGLLLDDAAYRDRFERALYDHLAILRDGWFPAGLTAHRGITRQLVNHHLDFSTMRQQRHWPAAPIATAPDPATAIAEICQTSRAVIDAMRAEGEVVFGLTAGNETRVLLAICRDIAGSLDFVTVDAPETQLDLTRASEIADRFALKHRRLPVRAATEAQAAAWHARSGHCIGGPNMWRHPTVAPLAEARAFAAGLGGEIGRAFFWRASDTEATFITPETITARFGMAPEARVTRAVADWHPSVAAFDAFLQLDLAYLELRMGCWGFAQAYADPDVFNINPMISRRAFQAMLSLPPDWRRQNRMITEAIAQNWPELLDFPINRYGDYRDTLRLLTRAARQPHLVVKKARKMFA